MPALRIVYIESDDPRAAFEAIGTIMRREQPPAPVAPTMIAAPREVPALAELPAQAPSASPAPGARAKPGRGPKMKRRGAVAVASKPRTASAGDGRSAEKQRRIGEVEKYLRRLGKPARKSEIGRALDIKTGSQASYFRDERFTVTDSGLLWLAGEAEPASDDEEGEAEDDDEDSSGEDTAITTPAEESEFVEDGSDVVLEVSVPLADEPFVDDPPFTPLRLPTAIAAPPPKRKPGRPPTQTPGALDDLATPSAVSRAVDVLAAELCVREPQTIPQLARRTHYGEKLVAEALASKRFEKTPAGYRLADA